MRPRLWIARVLTAACLCAAGSDPVLAQCRRVWDLTLPSLMPVDGFIYDTTVWDDGTGEKLYAVGFFAVNGQDGWKDGIARWTGTAWESVGGGVGYTTHTGYPEVHAVTVYNGELVIAGDFTRVGDVPANNIARWNGVQWTPLGDGFPEIIYALAEYQGKLIAGGSAWDGQAWTSLPSIGTNWSPLAMTVFNGDLIVGAMEAPHLARFNGTSWTPLGLDGPVEALTVYNGELIAGGWFWRANGVSLPNIARWNGTRWAALHSPFEVGGMVTALAVYDGALIVGGHFTAVAGMPVRKLARWNVNGSGTWSGMGTGVPYLGWDDAVFDFSVLEGDLIAAGGFPRINGQGGAMLDWARWRCTEVPDATPVAQLDGPYTTNSRSILIDGDTSFDPDGTSLLFYYFDFGDGTSEFRDWPRTQHTYPGGGVYTVTLRVSDGERMSDPFISTVTVNLPNAKPTVSVTDPVSGATLTAPAQIVLRATAADADGTVTAVEFFQGSTSLGIDTAAPYQVVWSNVAAGRYTITARATDNAGAVSTSAAVTVSVERLVAPVADASVRDGSGAATNFGSAMLEVRTSSAGNNRWTYLRFDTSGVSTISSAKLRLFGTQSGLVLFPITIAAYGSSNVTWGENTITWNNKPASLPTSLDSLTLANSTSERWYEWDLTSYIKQEKQAGRHVVTIVLKSTSINVVQAVFRSRQQATNQPRLAITP